MGGVNKKIVVKVFMLSAIFIPIIIGVISGLIKDSCNNGQNYFIQLDVNSVVKDRYVDPKNHNGQTLLLRNDLKIHMISTLARSIYDSVEIGDSILKYAKSRKLIVFKRSGEIIEFEELNPDCEYLLK